MIQTKRRITYMILLAVIIAGFLAIAWHLRNDKELYLYLLLIGLAIAGLGICILWHEIKCRKIDSILRYWENYTDGAQFICNKKHLERPDGIILYRDKQVRNRFYALRKKVNVSDKNIGILKSCKITTPEAYGYILHKHGLSPFDSYESLCKSAKYLKEANKLQSKYIKTKEICEKNCDAAWYVMQKYGITEGKTIYFGCYFQSGLFDLYPHVSEIESVAREIKNLENDIHSGNDKDILIWFLKEFCDEIWEELPSKDIVALPYSEIISAVSIAEEKIKNKSDADKLKKENRYGYEVFEAIHGKIEQTAAIDETVYLKILEYENDYRIKIKDLDSLYTSCTSAFNFYCSQNNINWIRDRISWTTIFKLYPLYGKIKEYQKKIDLVIQLQNTCQESFNQYFPHVSYPSSPKQADEILAKRDSIKKKQDSLSSEKKSADQIRRQYPVAVKIYLKKLKRLYPTRSEDKAILDGKAEILSTHQSYLLLKKDARAIYNSCPDETQSIIGSFDDQDIEYLKAVVKNKEMIYSRHRKNLEKQRTTEKAYSIKTSYPDGVRLLYGVWWNNTDSGIIDDEESIVRYDKLFNKYKSYSGGDFLDFLRSISIQRHDPSEWTSVDIDTIDKNINDFISFPSDIDKANRIIAENPEAFLKLFSSYTASYSDIKDVISKEECISSLQLRLIIREGWKKAEKEYPEGVRVYRNDNPTTYLLGAPDDRIIEEIKSNETLFKEVYRLFRYKEDAFQQLFPCDENQLLEYGTSDLEKILLHKEDIDNLEEKIEQEIKEKELFLKYIRRDYPQGYEQFCRREGIDLYSHKSYQKVSDNLSEIHRLQENYNRKLEETRAKEAEMKRMIELCTKKKTDAEEIEEFLKRKLIGHNCLYHFTAKDNIASIKKNGGLYSWFYCETHGININRPGGDNLSHQLDLNHGLEDYVRLSFCHDHPMSHNLRKDGIEVVLLEISPEVALLKSTLFSDRNATSNDESHGPSMEDLLKVDFHAVRTSYLPHDNPLFSPHQAEVMVKTWIPARFILNLDSV